LLQKHPTLVQGGPSRPEAKLHSIPLEGDVFVQVVRREASHKFRLLPFQIDSASILSAVGRVSRAPHKRRTGHADDRKGRGVPEII